MGYQWDSMSVITKASHFLQRSNFSSTGQYRYSVQVDRPIEEKPHSPETHSVSKFQWQPKSYTHVTLLYRIQGYDLSN